MSETFKKTVENFICENCGEGVDGDGYTNHCPHCLWSKHVDIHPGDRAETCGGLMEPVDTEGTGDNWCVIQKCCKCGKVNRNKLSVHDNFDKLVNIAKNKN